ncbi:MAG: DUF2225 domain-containing protein [Melioribacteraceae bacterium]|nr:DUF2225 domain-containing protein [Melioribacteraceae bacterium]
MTTFLPQLVNCIICNTQNEVYLLTSTNSFGSPDLDYRPAGMARYTLIYQIQTCSSCGFSAPIISEDFLDMLSEEREEQKLQLKLVKELINTKEYKSIINNRKYSDLFNSFYAASLIQEKIGNITTAFHLALKAAWSADDRNNKKAAKYARSRALELLEQLTEDDIDKVTKVLINIDLLRRNEEFTEVNNLINLARNIIEDEEALKIINYQRDLELKKDSSVRSINELVAF